MSKLEAMAKHSKHPKSRSITPITMAQMLLEVYQAPTEIKTSRVILWLRELEALILTMGYHMFNTRWMISSVTMGALQLVEANTMGKQLVAKLTSQGGGDLSNLFTK